MPIHLLCIILLSQKFEFSFSFIKIHKDHGRSDVIAKIIDLVSCFYSTLKLAGNPRKILGVYFTYSSLKMIVCIIKIRHKSLPHPHPSTTLFFKILCYVGTRYAQDNELRLNMSFYFEYENNFAYITLQILSGLSLIRKLFFMILCYIPSTFYAILCQYW